MKTSLKTWRSFPPNGTFHTLRVHRSFQTTRIRHKYPVPAVSILARLTAQPIRISPDSGTSSAYRFTSTFLPSFSFHSFPSFFFFPFPAFICLFFSFPFLHFLIHFPFFIFFFLPSSLPPSLPPRVSRASWPSLLTVSGQLMQGILASSLPPSLPPFLPSFLPPSQSKPGFLTLPAHRERPVDAGHLGLQPEQVHEEEEEEGHEEPQRRHLEELEGGPAGPAARAAHAQDDHEQRQLEERRGNTDIRTQRSRRDEGATQRESQNTVIHKNTSSIYIHKYICVDIYIYTNTHSIIFL